MRYASLLAVMALASAWGQTVKPTPGALGPATAAPEATLGGTPAGGSIGRTTAIGNKPAAFRKLEGEFDYGLKTSDPSSPIDLLGSTRGIYVQGYGAVFTTEVDLAWNNYNPMFVRTITDGQKAERHDRKLKNLPVLRKQMQDMVANMAKTLDLPPSDRMTLAVRLLYLGWEDRTGLPDQIVMTANSRGGDLKVDVQ